MAEKLLDRIKHAWNAFFNKDPTNGYRDMGSSYSYRPDRPRFTRGNERTIVTSIYNRIALDVASLDIHHVRLDENDRYTETLKTKFEYCLNDEANIDQTGRNLMQDIVMSMFDEGVVAVVPVDATENPILTDSYDILSLRTGKILEWYPQHVKVRLYNDRTGEKQEKILPKKMVAIIENPFYQVINEPNSIMQRLVRKLSLLDAIDEQSGSGKLDLLIQLPYAIKTDVRRKQADIRRDDLEKQLSGSKYGIAYIDSTEKVTQLNRSLENNLLKQIEYLTSMLYSQLSMDQTVLAGTANEATMINYQNRVIEVIAYAITSEFKRKFLTKTARSQGQSVIFFRDPFKLATVERIAEMSDKFTRNEILSKNEIRQVIGRKPSSDPKADQLINSNISHPDGNYKQPSSNEPVVEENNEME